jgi:hypothetical protein
VLLQFNLNFLLFCVASALDEKMVEIVKKTREKIATFDLAMNLV